MTLRRAAFWCGAGLAALLGAAAITVALAVYRPQLLLPVVRRALAPAGGSASLGGMTVGLNPPSLTLSGLALAGWPQEGDLLRVDHFRLEWAPAQFLRGGPRWRHVEARGLVFERSRPGKTAGPPDLTPLARLFDIENLSVADARLRLALHPGTLLAEGLRLTLVPGEGGIRRVSGRGRLTLVRNGSVVAEGHVAANGQARAGPAIDLALEFTAARLDLPWMAGGVSGHTLLRLTPKAVEASELDLSLIGGRLIAASRQTGGFGPVRLNATASATLEGKDPRLDVRALDVGGMILARGRLSGSSVEELSGTADGEIPSVERVKTLLAPLFPASFAKMDLDGKLHFRFGLETRSGRAQPGIRLAATATFEEIGFSLAAGDAMGRNLAGRFDLDARLGPRPRVKADLTMSRGEALWGTVYLDLARHLLDLHARGTRRDAGIYEDVTLEGGLAGLGRLAVTAAARRDGERWRHRGRMVLRDVRLGPVFGSFVRDPLVTTHPDLAALQVDGTARMELAFSGSEKEVDLDGRLRLHSGNLRREEEPPLLSGLDIDLPIAYSVGAPDPGRPEPSGTSGWGRLRLKELRLAGQDLGPLEMPVALVPNRLYLGGDLGASLFGGRLFLQRIRVDEPLAPGFRVHLAARLDGLDLGRVAGKDSALEGRMGGLLDPVLIGRDRVTAAGVLTGELFGGRMEIRGLAVDRPFGPGREIGGDVHVSLLDLERLSAALGVGRVTGRLSGSMEGLRIAYGQPVAFHLRMESVPVKGVTQSASLKAVDSISLVSTGSPLSGAGSSIVTKLFREFPYSKIGIECRLKNDVFTVRGLIHEDGVEYMVRRRLFSGIDVINRNPDNRIGFSDMLERTRRATGERFR